MTFDEARYGILKVAGYMIVLLVGGVDVFLDYEKICEQNVYCSVYDHLKRKGLHNYADSEWVKRTLQILDYSKIVD